MHVNDIMSDTISYQPSLRRRSPGADARRDFTARNSTGLTDGFDAPTEAPTEWNHTGIEGIEGRDYEISVSGYRNYVHEMERMLDEEADSLRSLPRHSSPRRTEARTTSVHGLEAGLGVRARHRSLRSRTSTDDVRQLASHNEGADLVQERTVADGPSKSISLWRERVAQSQSSDDRPSDVRGNTLLHRRKPSSDALRVHAPPSRTTGRSSGGESKSKSNSKGSSGDYERTEYIISYQQPARNGPVTQQVYTASEIGLASPRSQRRGTPASKGHASSPRRPAVQGYAHTESVMTYQLHTPPHSQNSSRSSPKSAGSAQKPPMSPTRSVAYVTMAAHDAGGATSSPVDLILDSCEPSLLHIGPALNALGICKIEHLRAVRRLTEETRNRELREPALKRGVTVMEWAILLDKILTL